MEHKKKLNVVIFFGGKSSEHKISIFSTRNIYNAISKEKYNIILVKIEKNGSFSLVTPKDLLSEEIYLSNFPNSKIYLENGLPILECENNVKFSIDIAFPVLHGPYGEDGKIQGFFETLNIKYVGCDTLSSGIGMQKDIAKILVSSLGINTAEFLMFKKHENICYEDIKIKLTFPLFVKPVSSGSSFGTSKANDIYELKFAVKKAFEYGDEILIEEFINGREVEIGILGNIDLKVSGVGEIVSENFYSYEAKYENGGAEIIIPANLSEEIKLKIQKKALQIFKILKCSGLSRVDFFVTNNKIIFNEINTFPGFTNISMYPKLFEKMGLSYSDLLDKLINLAIGD